MKILIIEDEKALTESIATYLKGEDYLCESADDFRSALEKTELYDYDCILLDIGLPGGYCGEIFAGVIENCSNKQDAPAVALCFAC